MALEGLSFEPQNNADSIQTPFWHPEESDYEDHERYCQGGYCPITLYQKLKNERYRIEYKLGHGHFATVWLARDTQSPEKRQVALKILTADKTTGSLEAQLLRMIAASISPPSPGPTYVVDILDEFEVVSANGNHRVLVMPVTRSMTCLSNSKIPFRSVAKSLLKGLARIHSAGIVHGGINELYYVTLLIEDQTFTLETLGSVLTCGVYRDFSHRNSQYCLLITIVLPILYHVKHGKRSRIRTCGRKSKGTICPSFLTLVMVIDLYLLFKYISC